MNPTEQPFTADIEQPVTQPFAAHDPTSELSELLAAIDQAVESQPDVATVMVWAHDGAYLGPTPVGTFDPVRLAPGVYKARLYGKTNATGNHKGFLTKVKVFRIGKTEENRPTPAPTPATTPATAPTPASTSLAAALPGMSARDRRDELLDKLLDAAIANMIQKPAAASSTAPVDEEAKFDKWLARAEKFAARLNGATGGGGGGGETGETWAWVGDVVKALVPTLNRFAEAIERRGKAAPQPAKHVDNTAQTRTDAGAANGTDGGRPTPSDATADEEEETLTPEQEEEARVFKTCRDTVGMLGQHASMGDVIAVLVIGHKRGMTDGAIAFRIACVIEQDWDESEFPSDEHGFVDVTKHKKGVAKTIADMHGLIDGPKASEARDKLAAFVEVPSDRVERVARIVTQLVPRGTDTNAETHTESEGVRAELDTRGNNGGAGVDGLQPPSGDSNGGGAGHHGSGDASPGAGSTTKQTPARRRNRTTQEVTQ